MKFTIDGKTIEAQPGQTVLQAALENGIHIPHLCYHQALPPFGGCRLCIVEVKGGKAPIASCALPAKEGMEVTATSPKLFELRKTALDLIISDHPLNCLTCEKNGDCVLQKYAYEFGLEKTSYEGETTTYQNETGNPLIEMAYKHCVMCGRCVLACNEAVVNEAIDFTRRGFATKITTPLDMPRAESDCVFCGACVDVCPVGALTDLTGRFQGRITETQKASVVCPYCGCGCRITLDIKDNRIVRSKGNFAGPANHGWLCIKGHFGLDFIRHQDRLGKPQITQINADSSKLKDCSPTLNSQLPEYPSCSLDESIAQSRERLNKPLIRKDGALCEATWPEAIETIVNKFAEMKQKHGSESLAALASAKCSNEENYLMQKFCRVLFGNNNIDHCARLCHAPTVAGLAQSFGSGAMTNSFDEIEGADLIMVIGSNTTEAHPVVGYAIKRAANKGSKVIVCDPRRIELVDFSAIHLQQKCGSDVALVNAMMHTILKEGLENKDFIQSRTEGFDEFRKIIENYPPEKVSEISGVPAEDIKQAARLYASARNAMIFYSMGITQHTTGTDNALTLSNLVMLCGQVGKPSSGLNPLRGQSNVQGSCDAGALPNVYPGYQKVSEPAIKDKFQTAYGIPLSDKPGLTVTEIVSAAAEGKIKGLYIMGENPMLSDPDISHTDESLKQLEFLVVQDMFLTETAQRAHVVLPACSFAEKEGTYTNTERRVQLSPAALKPLGESLPDWQILAEIGARLAEKLGIKCKFDYKSLAELTDEFASLAPIYGGITHDRLIPPKAGDSHLSSLISSLSLQWPCPTKDHPGTRFLHKDKFTRGLGKFHPVEYRAPAEEPDAKYPFVLTTGRVLEHYHTGSMSRRSRGPAFVVSEGFVQINPVDAERLGIQTGQRISVASRRGSIDIKAEVTDGIRPGTVFIPFHFAESAANMLTNTAVDPVAKIPEFKVCAVRVTK
jgi:formate dehydrogenase alpha subunit